MAKILEFRYLQAKCYFALVILLVFSFACGVRVQSESNTNLLLEIRQELKKITDGVDRSSVSLSGQHETLRNKRQTISGSSEKTYWNSYRFGTGTGNREVLRINGVHEEKWIGEGCSGDGVRSWQSLEIGRNQGLLLGLGSKFLVICSYSVPFLAANDRIEYPAYSCKHSILEVSGFPTAAAMFQTWNDTSKTTNTIAVVALNFDDTSSMLMLYSVLHNDERPMLTQLPTTWPLQGNVWYLLSFKIKKERTIVVLNHPWDNKSDTSIDLHGFNWQEEGKTDFWLIQKLIVEEASSIAVVNVEETAFLGISQPDNGIITLYQFDSTIHKLVYYQEIEAPGVSNIVSFYVGFSAFIAVAGNEPMLLRYDKEEFVTEKIEGISELGRVLYWLPVPIRTYRDEVVLLAENEVDQKRLVSIVTWTGGHPGFSLHSPTTCHVNGESMQGLWCLLNYGSSDSRARYGLQSAAALGVGCWAPGLIIPRSSGHSALFRLEADLEPVLSPMLKEINTLVKRKAEMEAIMAQQMEIIQMAKDTLENTLNREGNNTISGNWEISKLQGEVVKIPDVASDSEVQFSTNDQGLIEWYFGGLQWSPKDAHSVRKENLVSVANGIKNLTSSIEEIKLEVLDAVPLQSDGDEIIVITAPKTFKGTIVVEGKMMAENLNTDILNDIPIEEIFTDIVRLDRKRKIGGHKLLTSLIVENLHVMDQLGEISVSSLVFSDDEVVRFNGNITYMKELKVYGDVIIPSGGLVNSIDLSEDVIAINKTYDLELDFVDSIMVENVQANMINNITVDEEYFKSLFRENEVYNEQIVESSMVIKNLNVLGENLQIKTINGQDFEDFLSSLVHVNDGGYIHGETYIEDCRARKNLETKSLNGLPFPDGYVRTSGKQVITGRKYFTNTDSYNSLQADVLILSGYINTLNTSHLITLSQDQVLHETFLKFEHLEVTNLQVTGTIEEMPVSVYANSADLGESSEVYSDVFVTDIEVGGDFIVNGMIDETSWEELLGGMIYDDEDDIVISSPRFVIKDLAVDSLTLEGLMNGLDISDFLTTDTEQTFVGRKYIGNDCTFKNIDIANGMINEVKILDFYENSVKLSGGELTLEDPDPDVLAQKIFGTITFEEEVFVSPSLWATKINGFSSNEVAFTNQDQEFMGDVTFESFQAVSLEVAGSLKTKGEISGVNLKDFDEKRFSLSRPQEIEEGASVHIHDAFIDGDLLVSSINGVLLETLDGSLLLAPEYDSNVSYEIENIIVNGTIITARIGEFYIDKIKENAIWLNMENFIEGPITFEEQVVFETLNVEGTLNGYDLNSFLEDIVYENEDVVITGSKTFVNGFKVGEIKAISLNGTPLDNILTTNTEQEIKGPLVIKGNVVVDGSLNFSPLSEINGMKPSMFAERYEWRDGDHVLKGDVKVVGSTKVDNLSVSGLLNHIDWDQFISSIVFVNDDVEIKGNITFNKKVVFEKDITVFETVDEVNVEALFGSYGSALLLDNLGKYKINMAYGEDDEPLLRFQDDVVIHGGLYVTGDIVADEVYGCSLKEWAEKAIYLDQSQIIQGKKIFQSMSSTSNVSIKFINGIDLYKVILLNGDQTIDGELNFKSLYVPGGSNVYVGNMVNGYNLKDEFSNTLLVEGDQIITGKKSFVNQVRVRGDVLTDGTINNIITDDIATLDTDQEFTGLVMGNHFVAKADVRVLGFVNGRNLNQWVDLAVCKDGCRNTISGRWNVLGNVTFLSEDVQGNGTLDGVDVSQLYEIISLDSSKLKNVMYEIKENLSSICQDLQDLREQVISQSFLFRHLEAVQNIKTRIDIQSMYHFGVLDEDYLVISYVGHCGSDLYVWDPINTNFILVRKLNMGPILEWYTLGSINNKVVIVAESGGKEADCHNLGYNLWHFDSELQQVMHSQVLNNFKSVKVLPMEDSRGHLLYTLQGENAVTEWSLNNDGYLMESRNWNISGEYLTLVQENDWEVRIVSEDKKVYHLNGDVSSDLPDIYTVGDYEILSISEELMLGAFAVYEDTVIEGTNDYVKVINLNDGSFFTKIPAVKPSSLAAVNFGYNRQKMLAFLEDSVQLKMFEYKGALGFVEYLSIPVRSSELLALPLKTRNLFSPHNFILVQSKRAIVVFEAEMHGDPIFGMPEYGCL